MLNGQNIEKGIVDEMCGFPDRVQIQEVVYLNGDVGGIVGAVEVNVPDFDSSSFFHGSERVDILLVDLRGGVCHPPLSVGVAIALGLIELPVEIRCREGVYGLGDVSLACLMTGGEGGGGQDSDREEWKKDVF